MSVLQRGLPNQDAVFTVVSIRPQTACMQIRQALARVFAQQTGSMPPSLSDEALSDMSDASFGTDPVAPLQRG